MLNFLEKFDFESDKLFGALNSVEARLVSNVMENLEIKKGSRLFYEDGIPTGVFQLKKGRAKKSKRGFNGDDYFFVFLQ